MPDTGQPRGDGAIQDWLESDVVYYIGPLVTIYRYQFQHCPQLIPWTLARALEIAKPNSSHTGLFQLPCGLTQAGGDNHIVPRGLRTDRNRQTVRYEVPVLRDQEQNLSSLDTQRCTGRISSSASATRS